MTKRILFLLTATLVATSMILGACAPAAAPTTAPTEAPAEPETGGKPYEGVTINIMMEGVPDTEFVQQFLPQFEEETGMKVNIEVLNYALMHEKLVPQLTAPEGAGSYDVIVVDNYWVGEFVNAGWLAELDDRLAGSGTINLDDYLPSMVDMAGQLTARPT